MVSHLIQIYRHKHSSLSQTADHIEHVEARLCVRLGNSCSAVLCQLTVVMEAGSSKMQEFTLEPSVDAEVTSEVIKYLHSDLVALEKGVG